MNKHQALLVFLVGILIGFSTSLVGIIALLNNQGVTVSIQQFKSQGD